MTGFRDKALRGNRDQLTGQATLQERAEMHTSLPGEVVDFDPEKQEATVKVLHVPTVNGEPLPMPELKRVPVVFPRGGGAAAGVMTWPIGPGDPVEVRFAERSIDKWYTEGGAQSADTNRMHDLSDAVAVPGGMRAEPQKVPNFSTEYNEVRMVEGEGFPKVQYNKEALRLMFSADTFIELTAGHIKIVKGGSKITLDGASIRDEASEIHHN